MHVANIATLITTSIAIVSASRGHREHKPLRTGKGNNALPNSRINHRHLVVTEECYRNIKVPEYLGDGFCDNELEGYNTEACGWDGGDCCKSTCHLNMIAGAPNDCSGPMACRDPISIEQHFGGARDPSSLTIYEEMLDLISAEDSEYRTFNSLKVEEDDNSLPSQLDDVDTDPNMEHDAKTNPLPSQLDGVGMNLNIEGGTVGMDDTQKPTSPDEVILKSAAAESEAPPDPSNKKNVSTIVSAVLIGAGCLLLLLPLAFIFAKRKEIHASVWVRKDDKKVQAVEESKPDDSNTILQTLGVIDEEIALGSPDASEQIVEHKASTGGNATIERHYNGGPDSMQTCDDKEIVDQDYDMVDESAQTINEVIVEQHCKMEECFQLGTKFDIYAPPGKLGIILDNAPYNGHPAIHHIKDSSSIRDQVEIGDELIAVDEEDVSRTEAMEVSRLISRMSQKPRRKLTFVRPSHEMKRQVYDWKDY